MARRLPSRTRGSRSRRIRPMERLGRPERFRHGGQLAERRKRNPFGPGRCVLPGLVCGGREVPGNSGRCPLVAVPFLDATRCIRVDVRSPLWLVTERGRPALPGRGAALLTARCPLVERFVFHEVLPPCQLSSSLPSLLRARVSHTGVTASLTMHRAKGLSLRQG